ncbi:MAG: M48 family metalloprotease [Methylophilaceae bacterium]
MVSLYAPKASSGANDVAPEFNASSADPIDDISDFYSEIDMRMRLAIKPNQQACSGEDCLSNRAFDAEVQVLGERLAQSAYAVYPDLKKTTPKFQFSVADKKVLGSASNGNGEVVIFRSIQHLDLAEPAIAFLIAREMGHVIGRHHKSNAKTKLLFTVLTGVLFPAVSILSASSAAAQVSTATTVLTSAASTLTSYVGSEVALSRIKPNQLAEADDISVTLLEYEGLSKVDIAQALDFIVDNENSIGWEKDLNQSIAHVRELAGEPIEMIAELEPLPDDDWIADDDVALVLEASNEEVLNHLANAEKVTQPAQPVALEQPSIAQQKVTLITNESFAGNHFQVTHLDEAIATSATIKPTGLKKKMNKKTKLKKGKTKLTSKTKKNLAQSTKRLVVKDTKPPTTKTKLKKVSSANKIVSSERKSSQKN